MYLKACHTLIGIPFRALLPHTSVKRGWEPSGVLKLKNKPKKESSPTQTHGPSLSLRSKPSLSNQEKGVPFLPKRVSPFCCVMGSHSPCRLHCADTALGPQAGWLSRSPGTCSHGEPGATWDCACKLHVPFNVRDTLNSQDLVQKWKYMLKWQCFRYSLLKINPTCFLSHF